MPTLTLLPYNRLVRAVLFTAVCLISVAMYPGGKQDGDGNASMNLFPPSRTFISQKVSTINKKNLQSIYKLWGNHLVFVHHILNYQTEGNHANKHRQ